MDAIASFLSLVDAFGTAKDIGDARVSTLVFNDGGRIKDIRAGSDVGAMRLKRAVQWFSDNWPANTKWPVGVHRPVPNSEAEAAVA